MKHLQNKKRSNFNSTGRKKLQKKNLLSMGALLLLTTVTNGQANVSYNANSIPIASGSYNTALGFQTLNANTTGTHNTATGYLALAQNTVGVYNTATGVNAIRDNIAGSYNTANGLNALVANIAGYQNTAIGMNALYSNTWGSNNTALGYNANVASGSLYNATTIGANAQVIYNNSIQLGDNNVTKVFAGVGTAATLVTGGLQVTGGAPGAGKVLTSDAAGKATWQTPGAGWLLTGNVGTVNPAVFIGTTNQVALNMRVNNEISGRIDYDAQVANTLYGYRLGSNGYFNTAVGYNAHYGNLSGDHNVAIGYRALYNNFSGDGNTALGYQADMSTNNLHNATAIGNGALVNASNKVVIGANGGVGVMVIGGYANWSNLSDGRFKENIKEDVPGLDFITKLHPVTYTINAKKLDMHIMQNMPDSVKAKRMQSNEAYSKAATKIQTGFVAQEVEKTAKELGYNFDGVNAPQNPTDNYSIAYSQFVVPLVKAVQEQQQQIDGQKQTIEQLLQRLDKLEKPGIMAKSTTLASEATKTSNIELGDKNNVVLNQNVPNPFATQTTISYNIPQNAGNVQILFYDATGKLVKTAPVTHKGKGQLNVFAGDLTNGAYSYTLVIDGKIMDTKKMIKQH